MNKITEQDFRDAAKMIGCDVATIKAVREVEAPRGPFDEKGRITILFEPYIFYKALRNTGDSILEPSRLMTNPLYKNAKILSPIWDSKLYGTYAEQYQKLNIARQIDRNIASESTSWGSFQIMGFNHAAAGYDTVDRMIGAFDTGEAEHLKAFIRYIKSNHLDDELRAHDWAGFARQYNGASYWKNDYDKKLKAAYKTFS